MRALPRVCRWWRSEASDAAEDTEAAVDRDNRTIDKGGARAAQPGQRTDQLVWFAEAAGWRVLDNCLPARGEAAIRLEQQAAVLLADEEAGGERVDAQAWPECARQLNSHP